MGIALRRIRALLWVGAALHGCSSPSEGTGTAPSGPVSQSGMPAQFAQTLCPGMAACCQAHNFAHDDATCKQSVEGTLNAALVARQNLKVVYDPNAAGRCLDAYTNAFSACADPGRTVTDACHGIWVGTVDVGGACTESQECKDTPSANASCSQGRCTVDPLGQKPARAQSGEPCIGTCTENGSGYSCSSFAGSSTTAGSCYTNDGLGCDRTTAKCTPLPILGQPCDVENGCATGAYCNGSVCVAEQSSGPCTVSAACTAESHCTFTTNPTGTSGSCLPKKADGSPCGSQLECQGDHCQNGLCGPRLPVSASLCAGLLD
jgi:hypothetical protein